MRRIGRASVPPNHNDNDDDDDNYDKARTHYYIQTIARIQKNIYKEESKKKREKKNSIRKNLERS